MGLEKEKVKEKKAEIFEIQGDFYLTKNLYENSRIAYLNSLSF
jgi:hypothetical protein